MQGVLGEAYLEEKTNQPGTFIKKAKETHSQRMIHMDPGGMRNILTGRREDR
jgi:hypothetical protein